MPVGLDRRKNVVIYSNHARADLPTYENAEVTFDHAFQVQCRPALLSVLSLPGSSVCLPARVLEHRRRPRPRAIELFPSSSHHVSHRRFSAARPRR